MGVRHVRDAAFWGVPVGTVIAPGMKPKPIKAAAKMAKGATAPGTSKPSAAALFHAGAGKGRLHAAVRPPAPRPSTHAEGPRLVPYQRGTGSGFDVFANQGPLAPSKGSRQYKGAQMTPAERAAKLGEAQRREAAAEPRGNAGFQAIADRAPAGYRRPPATKPRGQGRASLDEARTARDAARAGRDDALRRLADSLPRAASREQARAALSGLTATELRALAGQLGATVGSKYTKPRLIERLAEVAGRRLDSEAIQRSGRKSARQLMSGA